MADKKPIVVGNWKMNGLRSQLPAVRDIAAGVDELGEAVTAGLCVPSSLLYVSTTLAEDSALLVGAQDCHPETSGAFTGDISAEMVADCLAQLCIVGHSERREAYGESDALVKAKAVACLRNGLVPIVCIGETDEQNQAGRTEAVLEAQLRGSLPDGFKGGQIMVAYEPVWAIGTGRVPDTEDVARIHGFLRTVLKDAAGEAADDTPILYGGSVKPGNAAELLGLPDVGGALVGGASLKPADFLGICRAVAK